MSGFSTYLQKGAPQPHNQGGGAASDGVWEGVSAQPAVPHGFPSRSKQESTALAAGVSTGDATCQGLDRSPSVHPQLGGPVVRGGEHLVGVAILGAERQLIRGLHAAVDLWGGNEKAGTWSERCKSHQVTK